MKKLITLSLALAALICANAQNYSIRGTVSPNLEGKTIYLATSEGRNYKKLDSALVKDNKFQIDGQTASPTVAYLLVNHEGSQLASDFILENAVIAVSAELTSEFRITAVGTAANQGYEQCKAAYQAYVAKAMPLSEKLREADITTSERDSLRNIMEEAGRGYQSQIEQITRQNSSNYTGLHYLRYLYTQWPIEEVKEFLQQVPQELQDNNIYTSIKDHVSKLEKTAVGQPFVDITALTPEGKEISLSDYAGKGKLVLVDFWASWCGPCMGEMPNVKSAYDQYRSKGLEIVGISLDQSSDAWKQALVEQKMTWPQMSDLKGWKCEGAATYGVRAIPATVLIDKDGTIIYRDLRGKALLDKIAELLR